MGKRISLGDRVAIKGNVIISKYSSSFLWIEIENDTIQIPRWISSIGQYLPGYNWEMPPVDSVFDEYFYLNGKYTYEDKLYIARQKSLSELDQDLEDFMNQTIDGSIINGIAVGIYAIYTDESVIELQDSDIEFFDNTEEATHDHYAYDVFVIIQDTGTYIEYPINLKLLAKMV